MYDLHKGDTFLSGERSYRYSPMSSPELAEYVDKLGDRVKLIEQSLNDVPGYVDEKSDELYGRHLDDLHLAKEELKSILAYDDEFQMSRNQQNARLEYIGDMMSHFFRSRFIRFLNFFFCWFIYNGERVYPNTDKYAIYGKRPFLTRVKLRLKSYHANLNIWFATHFL